MKTAKPAREVNMHAASQRIEYIFFTLLFRIYQSLLIPSDL